MSTRPHLRPIPPRNSFSPDSNPCLISPTIHLNGTSASDLYEQLESVVRALDAALEAMQRAAPHGRDYYPQGDEAINQATRQHRARQEAVHRVRDEYQAIWWAVAKEL